MKKGILKGVVLLLAVLLFSLAGCKSQNPLVRISIDLMVDVRDGTLVSQQDSHGGFHGDGETFMEIRFSDDRCANNIQKNGAWKTLPLSKNVTALVYGLEDGEYRIGPMIHDQEGKPLIPSVQNGYYYFMDRSSESKDKYDETEVLDRGSFNFTVAIYDTDTNTLYYMELDT